MSAITLEALRNTILFRGGYENTRKFTTALVNTEIQSAFAEFYELVAKVHEGWWDTTGSVSTVASQAYVALPSDAWIVRAVDRLDGTDYFEMQQVAHSERNRYGGSTGKPMAYRLTARGIDMLPTPDAVYTLRVSYTPFAPQLSESQPRQYYNGWEDYVILATLLRLDQREQRPLQERMMALGAVEKRVREGAAERRAQEPDYLNLRECGDFSSWDTGELY